MKNIFDFVARAKTDFRTKTIRIQDGLEHSMYTTLRVSDLYYNSTFEGGRTDERGKEKPFDNIGRSRVHLATRATDDGGHIQIEPKKGRSDRRVHAMLINAFDSEWRDEVNFDAFRRKMRYTRAKYGGVIVKKHMMDGKLSISVVDWRNLIVDQENILANPIIERHLYTPDEILASDFDNKEEAIAAAKRRTNSNASSTSSVQNESVGSFIEVFEVSGEFPETIYDEAGDKNTYSRMKFLIVLDAKDNGKEQSGVLLYKGLQAENPYMYLPWIELQGRALGMGIMEMLVEPQVWRNFTKMAQRDMLDLGRSQYFTTDDESFDTQNLTTDVHPGHVFKLGMGKSLTQLNNRPPSFSESQVFAEAWETRADKESSSFDAITGEEQVSGTPYHQTMLLNQMAGSEFKYRRKEERDFIREMYRKWILPYHLSKINTRTEMEAVLSDDDLKYVDDSILATSQVAAILNPDPQQSFEDTVSQTQTALTKTKNRKITNIPPDFFSKDVLTDLDVVVGTENDNDAKLTMLERIFTSFSAAFQRPEIMQNPIAANIVTQAAEVAGLAGKSTQSASPAQDNPQGALAK